MNKFKVGDRVYNCKRIGLSPYYISNCGEVISTVTKNKVLKGNISSGYRMLILCYDNKREVARHHHLVMRWWVGIRPIGMVINHLNGVKTDNRLINLEYCTPKQNRDHATVNRLYSSGSTHHNSKLNEELVQKIYKCKEIGLSLNQIARAFEVSKKAISSIFTGKSWKYYKEVLEK